MFVKILLTVIFLVVLVGVGVLSRKQANSVDGFVLGGRSVGPWLSAFAYGTSYFSAVVFVGYAGQFGWKYGMSSTWIGVGNAVIGSLLAWLVLGRRTKLMTQHIESRTMPDFFGTRFRSQNLRVVASIIAFVFLIPYTAGVYKGISTLFEMGFGIPYEYCVILMAFLTALYVILGGYRATAMNDFIQGVIMLFGIVTIIAAVLAQKGGLTSALEQMAAIPADDNPAVNGQLADIWGPDPWNLLGVVVLTSLGTWGLPQMVVWVLGDCLRWWVSSIPSRTRVPSSVEPSFPRFLLSSWLVAVISWVVSVVFSVCLQRCLTDVSISTPSCQVCFRPCLIFSSRWWCSWCFLHRCPPWLRWCSLPVVR